MLEYKKKRRLGVGLERVRIYEGLVEVVDEDGEKADKIPPPYISSVSPLTLRAQGVVAAKS